MFLISYISNLKIVVTDQIFLSSGIIPSGSHKLKEIGLQGIKQFLYSCICYFINKYLNVCLIAETGGPGYTLMNKVLPAFIRLLICKGQR